MDETKKTSQQVLSLHAALFERGITSVLDFKDGEKTVDIAVPKAHFLIVVETLKHFTDSEQILADFERYKRPEGDLFNTFYITNHMIDKHLEEVADALAKIIDHRLSKTGIEKWRSE